MKNIIRVLGLLLTIVLCAVSFAACNDPVSNDPNESTDQPLPDASPTVPASDTSDEAFALFASVNQAADALSSMTSETVMDMTFYTDDLVIVASGVSKGVVFDYHGNHFAFSLSQTTEMEILLDGDTVNTYSMQSKEGFGDGTMFYFFSELQDGATTASTKLKSALSADEYRAHVTEVYDSLPEINAETCKQAGYKANDNGTQTAVFSSFNERGMRWIRDQMQGLDALLEEGVALKDMTCTLVADAQNLPVSLSIECEFRRQSGSQKLPEISLTATYSLPNATPAPTISTSGYTQVDDLRILDRLDQAIDRHLYKNAGRYALESVATVTVGGNAPEVVETSESGNFSTVGDKFVYEGTSTVNGVEISMQYENGSCEITMDGEQQAIPYTDEEMRTMLRNALDPATFSKGNVTDIRKSAVDSGTYILSLANSERVASLRDLYGATVTGSSETLMVRLNADGELIELAYQLNATLSTSTYGTIQVVSSAGVVITLN